MTTGQTTTPGKLKPHLALIFANVLFGMNFSFYVSIIHHYMDFEDLFFFRVAFAAVCFVPWTFFFAALPDSGERLCENSDSDGAGYLRA